MATATNKTTAPPSTFEVFGNWGTLVCCSASGNVLEYKRGGDWEKPGDGYDAIIVCDVAEWRQAYPAESLDGMSMDILDIGTWESDGSYVGPELDWRKDFRADTGREIAA